MSVKQNAAELMTKYPLAAVDKSLYVDDCLTGADTAEEASRLQTELQDLLSRAHFLLLKWNSSDRTGYTKALGMEWNSQEDVSSDHH